jgi:hypothetical protein
MTRGNFSVNPSKKPEEEDKILVQARASPELSPRELALRIIDYDGRLPAIQGSAQEVLSVQSLKWLSFRQGFG